MPAVKLKVRVSPTGAMARSKQVNGFYVHSSPPKVLQMNPSVIRQWLRGGEVDQLEQVVLEGQGHKLIGEYAPDPKVRAFLKQVPDYMAKIGELNDAVNRGNLKQLQKLAPGEDEAVMKNVMLCKDHAGVGLLHKAVYNDHPEIVKYLVKRFPGTLSLKDRDGKTALHYCGVCGDPDAMWTVLVGAGADASVMDARGRTAAYYMERPGDIQLPEPKLPSPALKRFTSGKNGLVVKPSNIRIWIHDRDLGRLQQVLWEGHGAKLRVETSNNPKVKRFLDAVPYMMNVIKEVHTAAINDDLPQFQKKSSDPSPAEILNSKDINGLTPLHKAAGLGHLRIVKDIVDRLPKSVFATDQDGRTPLHYAAACKDIAVYNCLLDHGADEMVFDQHGRMPSYYRTNPKDVPHKLLDVVPEAPRTSLTFPPAWDWSVLSAGDALLNQPHGKLSHPLGSPEDPYDSGVDIWRNDGHHDEHDDTPMAVPIHEIAAMLPRNDKAEKEAERKLAEEKKAEETRKAAEDQKLIEQRQEQERRKREEEETKKREVEEKNKREAREETERLAKEAGARKREETERLAREAGARKTEAELLRQAEQERMSEEQRERELVEERQRLLDEGLLPRDEDWEEEDPDGGDEEVNALVKSGDLDALANLVLEGEGSRLAGYRSRNPDVQSFLDNVPVYMGKMEAVHKAAREGELRAMQAALDRRRFAVAKDTALKATPLHVATLFGKTPIIKYLGGRFPETLRATDKDGRTALHYAACIPDNGHYFNLLLNLGADRKLKDKLGNTAQHYMDHQNELTQETLLKELSAPSQIAREMLSDKVPNDTVSSRRLLQDVDTIAMLDRCHDIVEGARVRGSVLPLVKHLTPARFQHVKHRVTRHDHTLLDVIWPGIRVLQEEEDQDSDAEESGGVIAPDFEAYVVFEDLLKPMIKDLHGLGGQIQLHPGSSFFKTNQPSDHAHVHTHINPAENGGIVAPDAESYQVYKEVLDPIVKDIHGIAPDADLKTHPDSEFHNKKKYKVTRTQILREELRQKRVEEASKKAEDDEQGKKKWNKRENEVNILVVDHDEEKEEKSDEESPVLEIMDMDPTGKYVLAARVECCRNLDKYYLPKCLRGDELEIVENKLQSALKYQSVVGAGKVMVNGGAIQGFGEGGDAADHYYSLHDIMTGPSGVRTKMAANDLLVPLAETPGGVHCRMIHGGAWPDHRGVYLSLPGNLAAWVNVQDHLRVVSSSRIDAPGNIGEPYGRVAHLIARMDQHLPPQRDPTLGFLTSRPACLGNTIRLQATVRLPRLPRDEVQDMCEGSNLVLSDTNLGDCVYKIRNRQSLGLTEYETYDNFTSTVASIVTAERSIAEEKSKHVSTMLKNMFNKRFNKSAV